MKPDYAYDTNRAFDFTAEDALVKRVQDAGLDIHGHVLVWHAVTYMVRRRMMVSR